MSVAAKICGLSTAEAVAAAISGGARFVGFIFYPPSPRHVTPEVASVLALGVGPGVDRVGVFVDPADELLAAVLAKVPLDLLQLHGSETPERIEQIKRRFGRPVMKAIPVASPVDVQQAQRYFRSADWLLFDAKPPRDAEGMLPGGNGLALDWQLLRERRWPLPWMLSGGLEDGNLAEAVRTSGATAVDVSSGVERAPGIKDPAKVAAFLARARAL
jgi:phosphoribosylanthranilate isomerase